MQNKNFYLPTLSILLGIIFTVTSAGLLAQTLPPNTGPTANETSVIVPLNLQDMMFTLQSAPMEGTAAAKSNPLSLMLPMPDGSERSFVVIENDLMSKEFALLYPTLKTYTMQAADDPTVHGRLTVSPSGVRASIFALEGLVDIAPMDTNDPLLHKIQLAINDGSGFACGVTEEMEIPALEGQVKMAFSNGATKITYKLAIVTTGEYYQLYGNGSVATAQAQVTAHVNALEEIYEKELAVNFNLQTPFIYTNPATDPFDVANGGRECMASEAVADNFNTANYDIGHALHGQGGHSSWGGGVAMLGALCSNNSANNMFCPNVVDGLVKGAGWSSMPNFNPAGDLNVFAHEIGHMFSMPHTWNGICSSAGNPPVPTIGVGIGEFNAYEIASGTTIMSYNNVCAQQNSNIGGGPDDYFHTVSLGQAVTHMTNNAGCGTTSPTGNIPPVMDATPSPCNAMYKIPKSTPFRLTGTGTDADGDQVYYCWEQFDEDGPGFSTQGLFGPAAASNPNAPLFRSYPPTTSPTRNFPNMSLVAANSYASNFEPLPTVARTMNFRLTGRDFKMGGGGIHYDSVEVTVENVGPFTVSTPGTVTAGSTTNVTWQLNGINFVTNVRIKLSVDGGLTFPYTLVASTPAADGSETVTIPAGVPGTTTAKIMVESADYDCFAFFDVSNNNFTITSACNAPILTLISPETAVSFPVGSGGLNLGLTNNIGAATTSINGMITASDPTADLIHLDPGGNCTTSGNQPHYVTRYLSVDVTGTYGFTVTPGGGRVLNLYSYPYTGPNCTNHIGSNVQDDGIGLGNVPLNPTLNAGELYILQISGFDGSNPPTPFDYDVTFNSQPSGSTIFEGVALPTGYSYTYLAVNTTNNQVAAVNATSNFTSLPAGSYLVYGAAYYSGSAPPNPANPATWVGQALSAVIGGSACVALSANSKSVTVTGGGGGCPSVNITCGVAYNGTTVGAASNIPQYSCISWNESGPEVLHQITTNATGNITATLSNLNGVDLDVFLIGDDCDPDNCIKHGNSSFTALDVPAGTYYVVVDGFNGVEGTYTLLVESDNCGGGPLPEISIGGSPANPEGNSGTSNWDFTVSRTGSTASPLNFSYSIGAIGTNPADPGDMSFGTVMGSIPAGQPSTTIQVPVNGDTDVEPDETFAVTLQPNAAYTIGIVLDTGFILNDDVAVGYCAAGGGNPTDEKISNIEFNTINNPSTSTADYEDFTAISTSVAQGSTHSFTGTIALPYSQDEIIVWIDFNQDNDFDDPGEEVFNSPTGVGPHTGDITIPANAMTGATRMRVRLHDTSTGPNATPCGNSTYGQVEDYTVNITGGGGGPSAEALDLDGTDDEVDLGATLGNFGTGDFTIEGWIKTAASSQYIISKRGICGLSNFWNIRVNSSGKLDIEMCPSVSGPTSTLTGTTNVNNDSWHHFAFTRESGTMKIYIDGNEENSLPVAIDFNNIYPVRIGDHVCSQFNGVYDGQIDELRFWNFAKPASQIQCEMDVELTGTETGLDAYYNFNQGTAGGSNPTVTTLNDLTANNYDGTLTDFALTGATSNWVAPGPTLNGAGCGGGGCPNTLAVPGTISSNTYQAAMDLTSDGTVPNGNTVIFKAGTSILLEANFEVQQGAIFDAMIEGCTPFAPQGNGQ